MGLGGGLEEEGGSALKPVQKPQSMGRSLATAYGLWSLHRGPGVYLTGGQGDEAWAASVFKELRPVLGVGEPSLAL